MNRLILMQEEVFLKRKKKTSKAKVEEKKDKGVAQSLSRYDRSYAFDVPAYTFSGDSMNDVHEIDESRFSGASSVAVPGFCKLSQATDASTANFKLTEFNCNDAAKTPVPEAIRGNVQQVMEQLEVLRAELGKSISVNSGYRTVEHNKAVGGESNSLHLCGMAADIRADGITPSTVHSTIEKLIAAGKMKQGGLGIYNTFVHYDIRGEKARWDNRSTVKQKSFYGYEMQAGYYDWPDKLGKGDAAYDSKAVQWIKENRDGTTSQPGLHKAKYKSTDYRGYNYNGNSKTDPLPDWGVTDANQKKAYEELRKELFTEGGATSINTYDDQIVTVGWGFSIKAGGGISVIKYNMAASTSFANELLKVGLTIRNNEAWYVDIATSKIITGVKALEKMQWDEKVLSKLIQAMEANAKENTASQVKVFKEIRMAQVPTEVYQWPTDSIRLAVHLSHWLPVGVNWAEIKGSGGSVATIIKSFCKHLRAYQTDTKRNPKGKVYIKMEMQTNGSMYVTDSDTRFDMGNRAFIKAGDAGTIKRIPKADYTEKYKTEEAYRNYVFVELNSTIYLLP